MSLPVDVHFMLRLLPAVLDGAVVTVELSVLTFMICLVWGFVLAIAQLSAFPPLRWVAFAYVQIVRNTPLLIQMYLIYFGLSMAGFGLSAFASGLLALCLQNGGYMAEIYRGGLQSIPRRQFEAGMAVGMRSWTLYATIILPQMAARIMPALTNQAISIIKDTAQVAAISVGDIMKVSQVWVESSANTYDVFVVVGTVYIALTSVAGLIGYMAERRFAFAQ
jgi:polar amino acid transport system permease protein